MNSVEPTVMDAGEFLTLANRCGLELKEVDLAQLSRRNLIVDWQSPGTTSGYTALHLYVVAEYFRAVKPVRHPWATRPTDRSLDEVSTLAEEVNAMLEAAVTEENEVSSARVDEFLVGVERCLARIDPFGSLGEVIDLLHPDVLAGVRNKGRLYLELNAAVSWLSDKLCGEGRSEDDPMTEPMFGVEEPSRGIGQAAAGESELRSTQVVESERAETSEAAREAIDEVVQAAETQGGSHEQADDDDDELPRGPTTKIIEVEPEPEEFPEDVDEGLAEADSEPTVLLDEPVSETSNVDAPPEDGSGDDGVLEDNGPDPVGEQESEPVMVLDEEVDDWVEEVDEDDENERPNPGGFERKSATTERTKALNQRLEKLSEHDRKRSRSETNTAKTSSKEVVPPPSPAERIDELNRRRQIYMKEQNWEKLAELYEEGIGLFSDEEERQQIYLMLAMLYEVKLRDKESAFEAFGRAWKIGGGTKEGRHKAWEGIQRVSKSSGLHQRYLTWLQEQLSPSMEPGRRMRMQKELAVGLFADQQFERAFDSYADFLAERPNQYVTEETLSQLERLGEHVDEARLARCVSQFEQKDLDEPTRQLIEEFTSEMPA